MHIRASQLDIFSAACSFDATGTMAASVFEHIERIGADLPGVAVVLRRVLGKAYRKHASNHMSRDGRYVRCDMPDGSIIAVDFRQRPGAWLIAVESRTAWELLQGRDPGVLPWALLAYDEENLLSVVNG